MGGVEQGPSEELSSAQWAAQWLREHGEGAVAGRSRKGRLALRNAYPCAATLHHRHKAVPTLSAPPPPCLPQHKPPPPHRQSPPPQPAINQAPCPPAPTHRCPRPAARSPWRRGTPSRWGRRRSPPRAPRACAPGSWGRAPAAGRRAGGGLEVHAGEDLAPPATPEWLPLHPHMQDSQRRGRAAPEGDTPGSAKRAERSPSSLLPPSLSAMCEEEASASRPTRPLLPPTHRPLTLPPARPAAFSANTPAGLFFHQHPARPSRPPARPSRPRALSRYSSPRSPRTAAFSTSSTSMYECSAAVKPKAPSPVLSTRRSVRSSSPCSATL